MSKHAKIVNNLLNYLILAFGLVLVVSIVYVVFYVEDGFKQFLGGTMLIVMMLGVFLFLTIKVRLDQTRGRTQQDALLDRMFNLIEIFLRGNDSERPGNSDDNLTE